MARLQNTIEIRTRIDGYNSGRVYHLKAKDESECLSVGTRLLRLSAEARRRTEAKDRFEQLQAGCRAVYLSAPVQACISLLVIAVSIRKAASLRARGRAMPPDAPAA